MCKFIIPAISQDATTEERHRIMFDALNALDLSDKVEQRNGLTYLSWSAAWNEFKSAYPTATYEIERNPATGLPYFSDPTIGIMVFTSVTVDGITHSMWLPVMDTKNKAMKEQPYSYTVYDSYKRQEVTKTVEAATMFDVNKTIMRCLVKNLAMFGLGLYIFSKEDLPDRSQDESNSADGKGQKKQHPSPAPQKPYDRFAAIKAAIGQARNVNDLMSLYLDHQQEIEANPQVKALLTQRKQQLQLLQQ